jgi:hypothetical protein
MTKILNIQGNGFFFASLRLSEKKMIKILNIQENAYFFAI